MTVSATSQKDFTSRLINFILSIKPLANLLKAQAHKMMVKRAEKIGVPWTQTVETLSQYDWQREKATIDNPDLKYPDYYLTTFHSYDTGNLSWKAAWEVEPAAYAVHAKIWGKENIDGDRQLRSSYHNIIKEQLTITPQNILDLGCSVGMSTFTLQELYPQSQITGLDLSAYFLSVAQYRTREKNFKIKWIHAPAENTTLPDQSFDLISSCLMFHELPQKPAKDILKEAWRLLRSGGYLTIMDMNPYSEVFQKFPPYVFTLLKSTEPYLDDYMTLDVEKAIIEAGFEAPTITPNSPRHRTIIARKS
jgi:ubiquinone/menaquinone biosynthesis C-methylase UbiE